MINGAYLAKEIKQRYTLALAERKYAKSCLLIDDDHDDQLVFSIIIDKLGKSIFCVTADSALEGLKRLQEDPTFVPDSIFLDLNLPGMNGIDCLARIKADPNLSKIPIVIYTTSSQKLDIEKAKSLGAVDFIVKSHDVDDLTRKIGGFF